MESPNNHSGQRIHFAENTQDSGTNFKMHQSRSAQPTSNPDPNFVYGQEPRESRLIGLLDGMITFCLGALFFGLPLFFTGLTFQGLAFEKQIYFYVFILLALVAWSIKGVLIGEMKIRRTPLDMPILLLVVVYSVATFFSKDLWHSFWGFFGDPSRGLLSIISLAVTYYLIVSHYTKKRMFKVLGLLTVANLILALWAFLQIMGIKIISEKMGTAIPASTIGSLSGLGMFLGMMLPIIVMQILRIKSEVAVKKPARINTKIGFLFLTLILDIVLLLILYAFVSWSGILIGVSIFLVYVLAKIVRPAENWTWVPMILFVAILAISMTGNNSIARMSPPIEVSPSYSLSWQVAKESIKQSFILGSGPATYGYAFSAFHPQNFNLESLYNLRFYQGTGLFFEALSTTGILGTITLLLLALTFVGTAVYLLSINKERNKLYSLGMFSAAIILLVNVFTGRVEGPMLIIAVLVGSLAMAVILEEGEAYPRNLNLSLKASPKYALAIAFMFMVVSSGVVFLFVFIGKVFIADLKVGSAVRETEISENGSITKMATAIAWYAKEGRYFTRLGQEYLVLANKEALKNDKDRDVNLITRYLQTSIALSKQGRDMMPSDALAQETLAQSYDNAGLFVSDSLKLAEDAYNRGLTLEPHNPIYLIKVGQLKIAEGSAKKNQADVKAAAAESKDLFQKAIDEKPNLASAYYQLSVADELLDDKDGAISAMEKAVIAENSNANYVFNLARLHQLRGNEQDMKDAEVLYKSILAANDKEINTYFSLGLLYEKTKKFSDASTQYKKVLELLPEDVAVETKMQIQKMINNSASGIANTPENVGAVKQNVAPTEQSLAPVPAAPDLIQGGQPAQPAAPETPVPTTIGQ